MVTGGVRVMARFERTDAAYAVGEREVVSTIEEAREQARAALTVALARLVENRLGKSFAREAGKDIIALRASANAIVALLDATEPQEAVEPAEGEREALVEVIRLFFQNWRSIGKVSAALEVSIDSLEGAVDDLIELGEPRLIADEMVEAAAHVLYDTYTENCIAEFDDISDQSRGEYRAHARAVLEAAEGARR